MEATTDRLDWLKLALTPGVGPANFYLLIQVFETPDKVLGATEESIRQIPRMKNEVLRAVLKTQTGACDDDAKREMDRILAGGIQILTIHDSLYPTRLLHIPKPPPLLFYRGNIGEEDHHHFGIVGTRRCDSYGLRQTRLFAGDLAKKGLVIVSGLALGIDTAAHRGALSVGGKTWAFLPGGFANVYPPDNLSLAEEIAETGAVLTERPLDAKPLRNSFPARNRLVSGVSVGILVVQAPPKSGALITATQALEQSRDVFALPGRVDEPASMGPHRLIQDGAKLAISPEEVLSELNLQLEGMSVPTMPILGTPQTSGSHIDMAETASKETGRESFSETATKLSDPIDKKIFLRLEHGPVHIDRISADLDVPVRTVSERLLLLEMQGLIKRLPGMSFDLAS